MPQWSLINYINYKKDNTIYINIFRINYLCNKIGIINIYKKVKNLIYLVIEMITLLVIDKKFIII